MLGFRFQQISAIVALFAIMLVLISALINTPHWVKEEGMPIYPAILMTQAAVLGISLSVYGLYLTFISPLLNKRRLESLIKASPAKPWEQNKQWKQARVLHTSFGKAIFLWLFVINWWGAIAFFRINSWDEFSSQSIAVKLFCGLIAIIGLIMLRLAALATLHWLRFGRSFLLLGTLPGRIGEPFKAALKLSYNEKPKQLIHVNLSVVERFWFTRVDASDEFSRQSDVRTTEPIYSQDYKIPASKLSITGESLTIPIDISIPNDTPKTGPTSPSSEIIWKLKIEFSGKNDPKYQSEFEIPVF